MKKLKYLNALILMIFIGLIFMGCSISEKSSPIDLIQKKYSNEEYNILFNDEGLDKPLESVKYTSKYIPLLPVPEKMGYIFMGWYFDRGYRDSYDDEKLLLKMKDVTLYSKWQKEKFINDGKYEIDFSAKMTNDQFTTNSIVDKYGYKDFSKCILKNDTYIEKSGNELLLKLRYDNGRTVPYGYPDPFSVTLKLSKSKVPIVNKNTNLSSSKKDLFLDITNHNLNEPIYLKIKAINYHTEGLSFQDRLKSEINYTIEFKITKLKGLDEYYVDTKNGLHDGHYLVKSFYRQISNKETMMSTFNPVYGYIIAKDKKYKFVKKVNPYYGIISESALKRPLNRNFFDRGSTFANFFAAYSIQFDPKLKIDQVIDSEYYPGEYKADNFVEYSLEYHSDTDSMWQIFDLGDSLDKQLVGIGCTTGYMEFSAGMGRFDQIITLDYDKLIKVTPEYKPLTGEAYLYRKESSYYPSENLMDVRRTDAAYYDIKEHGISSEQINFFYTRNKEIKSFRLTTKSKTDEPLKDTRYSIRRIEEKYEIFDFNKDSILYADVMTVENFGGKGWRNQNKEIHNGKMVKVGDSINIKNLFFDKVSSNKLIDFTCKAYKSNNLVTDYNNPVDIEENFIYEYPIDLVYEFRTPNGHYVSKVQLITYLDPKIDLNATIEDNFDTSKEYFVGDKYELPKAIGYWGEKETRYVDFWYNYNSENASNEQGINSTRVTFVNNRNQIESILYKNNNFRMQEGGVTWIFELENIFGKKTYIEKKLKSKENPRYIIKNSDNQEILNDSSLFINGNLKPQIRNVVFIKNNKAEFDALGLEEYRYEVGSLNGNFSILEYLIKTSDDLIISGDLSTKTSVEIYDEIYSKVGENGGHIQIKYRSGKEKFYLNIILNCNFDGYKEIQVSEFNSLFTGREYAFPPLSMRDLNGKKIVESTPSIFYKMGDDYISYNSSIFISKIENNINRVTFYKPGIYRFYYSFSGAPIKKEVEVFSNKGNITIKYITDTEHKFKDGSIEKEVEYSLNNEYMFPKIDKFIDTNDKLLCYKIGNNIYSYFSTSYDLIKEFNSKEIEIEIIWDKGVEVILDMDTAKTGVENKKVKIYKTSYYSPAYYFNNSMIKADGENLSDIEKLEKFKFIGLESDVFEGGYISAEEYKKDDNRKYRFVDPKVIKVIFKKRFKLTYITDKEYTHSHFANEEIIEDQVLGENLYKEPKMKKEKESLYKFIGWYDKNDSTETIIDFNTFSAAGDLVIVAKFQHK